MKLGRIKSIIIMLLGLIMMFFGLGRGEAVSVFEKAIRICLECIGVG